MSALYGFTQDDPFTEPQPIVLDDDLRRRTHTLVVGSPGSGKSKFLEWLIRSDIQNRQGLCLLDIHGTLYNDIKKWCSYHYNIEQDIVLLDPSSCEYIKGFNPFRRRSDVEIDVQVSGMVQALLRVWGAENTNETPTLDRILRLLFTAMVVREIPLNDAFYLINFDQRSIRDDVIASFSDPIIRSAWRQIQNLTRAGEWRDEVLSTENRLFRLVYSPTVKRFMGVLDSGFNLDLLDIMNQGKVLLVNLKESKNLTEENAKAFAALILNDLFKLAIMFRDRDTLGYDPAPFYIYLDEWQNVVTPDIWKVLNARKFGLLLILANQDLAQIRKAFSDNDVQTLMTCCQAKACFGGLNRDDALRMAREMLTGQVDLTETKYEIESTKFWPTYQRDKVYTLSTFSSHLEAHTTAETVSTGEGSGLGTATATPHVWTSEGWIEAPNTNATSESALATHSEGISNARMSGRTSGGGLAMADIPILMPIPFTEVTSRATYNLDEQLWRWSDRFMEQYQRHCFVKLPSQRTIPMLVPFVEEFFVAPKTVAEYEKDVASLMAAKRPAEVDAILGAQPSLLHAKKEEEELSDESFFE